MMQVVPKWKVTVLFTDRSVVLWIHDPFIGNVLRKLADLQFTENGLDQPIEIIVGAP